MYIYIYESISDSYRSLLRKTYIQGKIWNDSACKGYNTTAANRPQSLVTYNAPMSLEPKTSNLPPYGDAVGEATTQPPLIHASPTSHSAASDDLRWRKRDEKWPLQNSIFGSGTLTSPHLITHLTSSQSQKLFKNFWKSIFGVGGHKAKRWKSMST